MERVTKPKLEDILRANKVTSDIDTENKRAVAESVRQYLKLYPALTTAELREALIRVTGAGYPELVTSVIGARDIEGNDFLRRIPGVRYAQLKQEVGTFLGIKSHFLMIYDRRNGQGAGRRTSPELVYYRTRKELGKYIGSRVQNPGSRKSIRFSLLG